MKTTSKDIIFFIFLFIFILLLTYANLMPVRIAGGDISVELLMAKHIITKGELHYFFLGQHYNGASAIQSYLLVPFFLLFGISSLSTNLLLLLTNIILFILLYVIVFMVFNRIIAILSVLFLMFATKAFWALRLIAHDYIVIFILNIIVFYFFYKAVIEEGKPKYIILFGLTAAIAYWALEFVIPLLFVMFIFWFIKDKKFFIRKRFGIFLASFFIGEIPLIVYNIKHNFANIKQLFAGTFIHRFICEHNLLPKTVDFDGRIVEHCKIFGDTKIKSSLPETLETITHSFFGEGISGYIYLSVFLISIIYIFFLNYTNIKLIFKDLFKLKNSKIEKLKFVEIFVISYLLLYFLAYLLSGFSDAQHLTPVYPFLAIAMGISFNHFFISQKNKPYSIIGVILIALVIISSMISYISIIKSNPPNMEDESDVIKFLDENKIKYVYTTFFIKWKLIFQSNEDIIASCESLCPCNYAYPLYEEIVAQQNKTALILWDSSLLDGQLKNHLVEENITFNVFNINSKNIYYNLSPNVIPSDFVQHCKYSDGFPSD